MKKIKVREVLLLIIPVVALGAWAWKTKQPSPTNKNGKIESTVFNVESRSATPRESYEGFDQRIVVNFTTPEIPPQAGWKQTSSVVTSLDNKNFAIKESSAWKVIWTDKANSGPERVRYVESGNRNQLIYALRAHDLPESSRTLFFRANLVMGAWFLTPQGMQRIKVKPIAVSLKVRNPNQKLKAEPTTLWRPFRLVKSEVKRVKHREAMDWEDTMIRIFIERTDTPAKQFNLKWVDPHLQNENGKRLTFRQGNGEGVQTWGMEGFSLGPANEWKIYNYDVGITMWRVLPKTGKVIFKGALSYNDGWPLPVEIVVRDK